MVGADLDASADLGQLDTEEVHLSLEAEHLVVGAAVVL